MSSTILITGGTGFIGKGLVDNWLEQQHKVYVLTRRPEFVQRHWQKNVVAVSSFEQMSDKVDIVVNLAGEGIADKRWSKSRKQVLRASRIDLTKQLVTWAKRSKQQFKQVISGSAVGFYGHTGRALVDENSAKAEDFAANLCADWESAAKELESVSEHFCIIRTGVVLGVGGGMLGRLALPFKLGAGGIIGDGSQYLPWIDLADERRAIEFLIQHSCDGVFNLCAPNPVTNQEFTKQFAALLKRPAILPMPKLMVKFMFGEMGELLLASQRVQPTQLLNAGFEFRYPLLSQSLNH